MIPDRRWFPRRPTRSQVFVTIDSVNRGIPRDLALGGLALDLAQPAADGQVVILGFVSPGSDDRIETGGEVVWTDDSGRIAGIRFLALPHRSYQKIENWLSESQAAVGTAQPPRATKADPLQGLRSALEEAAMEGAVEAATSQPSKRIRLRVPEILLNPYARRRLIVRSLSAAAVIALVVAGLIFLRSHRELIGAGSRSVRSAVLEVANFIHRNDAASDGKPYQTPNVEITELPSRHHGDSAAERARRSPQLAEGIKPTEAIQPDEVINPATGQLRFSSEAQGSNQLPAITILGVLGTFRNVPMWPHPPAGHSGIPVAPANPADPSDPAPATAAGKIVSQQISASLPEGSVVARATISQDGSVRSVRLVSGDPLLAAAVLDAVSQWRYKPWTYGLAEAETQITVTFTISTK